MTTAEAHFSTVLPAPAERTARRAAIVSPRVVRISLITIAAAFLGVMIVLPLSAVLFEAFRSGIPLFLAALAEPDALAAFRLTALTAAIVLPLNIVFGVAAAWSIAKFDWPGKTLVTTLTDLPFTVSPVVAGMAFVLLFGTRGWLGPALESIGVKVIFAVPGIIIATAFVTVPFIARELIPLMEAQSRQEEEAALSLGASGWRTFWRITLPNIKWGLIYGSILCAARAVGEFGAVSVVSGHIHGQTETVSLHVESLYGEYKFGAASALATVLIAFTLLIVLVRHFLQSRHPSGVRRGLAHQLSRIMSIEVRNITKRFGAFTALDDVTLRVETGELTAILGPSGSGKTSLLRVMAGLETADAGEVHFFGNDVTNSHVRERGVGFVFQHYALFRHMSVFDNVAFGLTVRPRRSRPSTADIKRRVEELLSLVQMIPHAHQFPSQLSGGQRQRVALARALALEPKVLLLDEPFGALDARVRAELRRWLRRLHDQVHVTSVFVTHDQEEALEVADRVVVLNHGRVEQIGPPADVYHAPANPFVCTFLGRVNIFRGRRTESLVSTGTAGMAGVDGDTSESSVYYVRPHEMDMVLDPALAGDTHVAGTVVHVNAAGPFVRVELQTTDRENLIIDVPHDRYRATRVVRGDRVFAAPRDHRVFENGAGI